ncbi:MAG TPA: hypothetical protein VNC78_12480 [Actinomycetota bacterium]|nr:hypothetical protein [Actinomycetota bacterium]
MRLLQDLRALRASWFELLQGDDGEERRASYELAVSARRFSRSARRVVDDKLAFSATLMRAGEVHAAHRLLEEVEREVRTEEAALLERVNEVTIAHVARRERMTRVRLARTLAVAMLGSSVMAFSAAGMAVAGMFQDRAESHSPIAAERDDERERRIAAAPAPSDSSVHGAIQNVKIKGKNVMLTESDLLLVEQLASGDVTFASVEQILNMLPAQVRNMIANVNDATPARETADKILRAIAKQKRKDRAEEPPATAPTEQPSQQPSEQPTPQPSEEPSEKPSSSPSPSNDPAPAGDDDDNGDDNESNSNNGPGTGTEDQQTPIPFIDEG